MRLAKWHMGKVVMLWAWGVALLYVDRYLQKDYANVLEKHFVLGWILLSLFLVIPLVLSLLTWIWLSGKEAGPKDPTPVPLDELSLPLQ